MSYIPVIYRLTIPASGSTFTPGQSADPASTDFFVTSFRDSTRNNYITEPPSDDGDELDVLESRITDAACQVTVSDASQATAYVTGWLGDTAARWQLLDEEAYVEFSTDGGASFLLLRHGFVTDIELPFAQTYRITVGGTRHKERSVPVSRILSDDLTLPHPVFHPTAIIGGPIFGGLQGLQPDIGLPLFVVVSGQDDAPAGYIGLQYVSGPMPPFYENTALNPAGPPIGLSPTAHSDFVNLTAAPFFVDHSIGYATTNGLLRGEFRGLAMYLFDPADPTTILFEPLRPAGQLWRSSPHLPAGVFNRQGLMASNTLYAYWPTPDVGSVPSVGTQFLLAVIPFVMTTGFPLYYEGHPLVVVDAAESEIGTTLEGTSLVAAKEALGIELWHRGRLTDPAQKVEDWIQQLATFFGFAFTLAPDSDEYLTVLTRDRYEGASESVDDAVLRVGGGPTWKLSVAGRRNTLRDTVTQFLQWSEALDIERPASLLVDLETTIPAEIRSSEGPGETTIELTLPGDVCLKCALDTSAPAAASLQDFTEAIGARLFDRHGRGASVYQFALTGTSTADPALGEMVDMEMSHQPNAQPGAAPVRGGTRPGRLIRRTREPNGDVLTLLDEGSGIPYASAFAVTVTDSTQGPGFVTLRIASGGTALAAAGALLDWYVALMPNGSASPPVGNGVLVHTTDMANFSADSGIVDDYGPLPIGPVYHWRAVAWVPGGAPSTATTDSLTPTPPAATISALVIVDIGTDWALLGWTVTSSSTSELIWIKYKKSADTTYTLFNIIPSASTLAYIVGLIPATAYDFRVELRDAMTTSLLIQLNVSGTTLAGSPTQVLQTPLNPRVFATTNPTGFALPGLTGLVVSPVIAFPQLVEFHVTPETTVGSGVPSTWPDDVSPDPLSQSLIYTAFAPDTFGEQIAGNDGRLRFWRARAIAGTLTPSPWTAVLSIMPLFDGSSTPPTGPSGGSFDGGSFSTPSYSETLDGGTWDTVYSQTVDGGGW